MSKTPSRTELMEKFLLHQAVADTLEDDGLSAEQSIREAEKRIYSPRAHIPKPTSVRKESHD